jgi:uncharacterized damage-inducible protein DinB
VPHSNAGLYVPELTRKRRVIGYVFVDAILPPDGGTVPVAPQHLVTELESLADESGMLLRGGAANHRRTGHRHPERILLRSDDPDDLRQGWSLVRDQWTATIQRVEQLPPSLQRQRVDGEWSVLETLRHLVFVADDWFGRTVLAEPDPYWRAGLVPTFLVEFQPDGVDPSEDPDLAEILDRFDARVAQLDQFLSGLTADELVRECPASLSLGESTPVTVLTCVQMVLDEFVAHRRYAERDINTLAQ